MKMIMPGMGEVAFDMVLAEKRNTKAVINFLTRLEVMSEM